MEILANKALVLTKPNRNLVFVGGGQGLPGTQGATGGAWLFVTGVPSNAVGLDGQTAYSTDTGNVYNKVAGAWVLQGTITGQKPAKTIRFSFGDATPALITASIPGKSVSKVEIELLVAFDTVSSLTVGDAGDTGRLFTGNEIDLLTVGKYESNPAHTYVGSTPINLYLSPGVGNTTGNGIVFVYIEE